MRSVPRLHGAPSPRPLSRAVVATPYARRYAGQPGPTDSRRPASPALARPYDAEAATIDRLDPSALRCGSLLTAVTPCRCDAASRSPCSRPPGVPPAMGCGSDPQVARRPTTTAAGRSAAPGREPEAPRPRTIRVSASNQTSPGARTRRCARYRPAGPMPPAPRRRRVAAAGLLRACLASSRRPPSSCSPRAEDEPAVCNAALPCGANCSRSSPLAASNRRYVIGLPNRRRGQTVARPSGALVPRRVQSSSYRHCTEIGASCSGTRRGPPPARPKSRSPETLPAGPAGTTARQVPSS
jgi:hypothetical protein